jgi:cytosine/adenosine deaminase-related metal-dependent hydrolase
MPGGASRNRGGALAALLLCLFPSANGIAGEPASVLPQGVFATDDGCTMLSQAGGADDIGRAKDVGSIEAGKLADILVLDANPLDDIKNSNTLKYVMKNGRLYDANTLDEVWPRQKKASFYWQHGDPEPLEGQGGKGKQ